MVHHNGRSPKDNRRGESISIAVLLTTITTLLRAAIELVRLTR